MLCLLSFNQHSIQGRRLPLQLAAFAFVRRTSWIARKRTAASASSRSAVTPRPTVASAARPRSLAAPFATTISATTTSAVQAADLRRTGLWIAQRPFAASSQLSLPACCQDTFDLARQAACSTHCNSLPQASGVEQSNEYLASNSCSFIYSAENPSQNPCSFNCRQQKICIQGWRVYRAAFAAASQTN